jgi:hypothetical protein
MGRNTTKTIQVENSQPEITLDDDFVFGAESEDDDDELYADIGTFGNPEHFDEDDEFENSRGVCEDCALGLCDCGYDFD